MCLIGRMGTPPLFFVVLFACLLVLCGVSVRGCVGVGFYRGVGRVARALGVVWGLWGVVDVGDELLCFVDQGVAEESGTGQQHQHNTSRQYVIEAEPRDR